VEEFAFELLRQLPTALLAGLSLAGEFKGILAEEALGLVFLPLHEFSFASCLIALGWLIIFWKSKGLLLSGVSHIFQLVDYISALMKGIWSWLKA
jgi:hypothetical protein